MRNILASSMEEEPKSTFDICQILEAMKKYDINRAPEALY